MTGDAPLTPIQRWYFDLGLENVHHFNQAVLFKSAVRIDKEMLEPVLQAVADHHDALRTCFTDGRQVFGPPGERPLLVVEKVESQDALEKEIQALQASFDLEKGPLFGAGLFEMDGTDHLVLAAHHLVIDGVSWRILLEDLFTAYGALTGGGEIVLPQKTTSYKEWAARVEAYAGQDPDPEDTAFWEQALSDRVPALALDHDLGPNDTASMDTVTVSMDRAQTRPAAQGGWQGLQHGDERSAARVTAAGRDRLDRPARFCIDLEGHGRQEVIEQVDISRTVGWFTSICPVILHDEHGEDLPERIKYVKETLHTIPHKGFTFPIHKYARGKDWPLNTGMSFNYLGQLSHPDMEALFDSVSTDVPGVMDAGNLRANLIDVVCMIEGGCLRVNFMYSTNKHTRERVAGLAASFKAELLKVIAHCLDPSSFDITPSDFDLMDVDQDLLDGLSDFK